MEKSRFQVEIFFLHWNLGKIIEQITMYYLLTATDGASATVNAISSSLTSSKSGIIGIPSSSSDPMPPISAAILTLLAVLALEASSAHPPVLRPRGGGGLDELSSKK